MASSYSNNLRIELIQTGEQAGVWGATTNNNLGNLIEQAICGYASIGVSGTSYTLTAQQGALDQSRNMVLNITGSLTDNFTLYIPTATKYYVIRNNTTQTATKTFSIRVTGDIGTSVTIPTGKTMLVFCDSANVSEAVNYVTNLSADTLTLTTPLSAASGGLPTQSAFTSCFLTTDGTTAYWGAVGIKTVKVATTAALTYPFTGLQAPSGIDGVTTLAAKDRVLVKDQGTGNESQNGIWVVDASTWSRAADANTAGELAGSIVNVQQGATNGGTQWATSFKDAGSGITANTWNSVVPLPAQTNSSGVSQANKVLTTDGTTASWASPAAKTVLVATTAAITLSGTQSIDGVTVALTNRVLVKNQTPATQNGIYVVASGTWSRAPDAASAADLASSVVIVQKGDTLGGTQWATTFKSSDTLDGPSASAVNWNQVLTGTVPTTKGGTNLTTYTKGDILYSDATNSLAKLPLSTTNGWVLTADTATGLPKWAASSSGGATTVSAGAGMNFTTFSTTGSVVMGQPSTLTTTSQNQVTGTTHTHQVTFPNTITSVNGTSSGAVVTLNSGTVKTTSGATTYTFTGIPTTANRITVCLSGVSSTSTDDILMRLGTTSGGIETSGYTGGTGIAGGTSYVAWSTSIPVHTNMSAAGTANGSIILTNLDANVWAISGVVSASESGRPCAIGGSKTLSGALTQIQLLLSASATFDGGSFNILYE